MTGWAEVEKSRSLRALGSMLALYYFMTFTGWSADMPLSRLGWEAGCCLPMVPWEWLADVPAWIPRSGLRLVFAVASLASLWVSVTMVGRPALENVRRVLLVLFWLKLACYLLDLRNVANFHHMHLYFSFFFLFAPQPQVWLRWCLVLVYAMAAVVKFTPSWWDGAYFASVPSGLPLLPHSEWVIRWACRGVILLELLAPLAFFAPQKGLRQLALLGLLGFHLYSGVIVGVWYTALMLPFLLLLFADGFAQPLGRPPGWLIGRGFLLAMALAGVWPWLIPGDVRYTAEGRYLGLCMFDANHRSRAQLEVDKADQHWRFEVLWSWPDGNFNQPVTVRIWHNDVVQPVTAQSDQGKIFFHPWYFRSLSTRVQNDPYVYYRWARLVEQRLAPERISLQLFSQLDGEERWVKVVDQANFRSQDTPYRWAWRNPWIYSP